MGNRELAIHYCEEFYKCKPKNAFDSFNQAEKGIGFILLHLYKNEKEVITAGDLAIHLGVSTARIAVLLKKMVNRGLLLKKVSPKDGRMTIVEITPLGKENVEAQMEKAYQRMERLIEEIGEEDIQEFIRISLKIKKIMERESTRE